MCFENEKRRIILALGLLALPEVLEDYIPSVKQLIQNYKEYYIRFIRDLSPDISLSCYERLKVVNFRMKLEALQNKILSHPGSYFKDEYPMRTRQRLPDRNLVAEQLALKKIYSPDRFGNIYEKINAIYDRNSQFGMSAVSRYQFCYLLSHYQYAIDKKDAQDLELVSAQLSCLIDYLYRRPNNQITTSSLLVTVQAG